MAATASGCASRFNGSKHSAVPWQYIDGFSSAWPGALIWEDGSAIVAAPTTWLLQNSS